MPEEHTQVQTEARVHGGGEQRCRCKNRKRQQILEAAARAFADGDFHRVKTDDIAAAAGVGKGTLFRYFATKEELFISTTFFAVEVASAEIERALAGLEDPMERLEAAFEELASFYRENESFFRMMHHNKSLHSHEGHCEFHRRQNMLRDKFVAIIADGQKSGHFRKVDAVYAGRVLFGMLRSAMRAPELKDSTPREITRMSLDFFINGVGLKGHEGGAGGECSSG